MDKFQAKQARKLRMQINKSKKNIKLQHQFDKENYPTTLPNPDTSSSSSLHSNNVNLNSSQPKPRSPLTDVSNSRKQVTESTKSVVSPFIARQNRVSIIAEKKRKKSGKSTADTQLNRKSLLRKTNNDRENGNSQIPSPQQTSYLCFTPDGFKVPQPNNLSFDLDTPISILAREIFSSASTSANCSPSYFIQSNDDFNTPDIDSNNVNNVMSSIQQTDDTEQHSQVVKTFFGISREYLDHGDPTYICSWCRAFLWKSEALTNNPRCYKTSYSMCCSFGKVQLPDDPQPPEFFVKLFSNKLPCSKVFIKHIRKYNYMFSFTSMGGKIDNSINNGRGPYVFRLSGQNYHRMGSLLPPDGRPPRYSQLYIYDTENEDQNRINSTCAESKNSKAKDDGIDVALINQIKRVFDQSNRLVKAYRMARDGFAQNPQEGIRLKLIGGRKTDGRTYNLPTVSELAGLIIGDIDSSFDERDIIVEEKSGKLKRISELHPSYLGLHYPLLFPLGQDGYRRGIKHRNVDLCSNSKRTDLTIREYFAYLIQERKNSFSLLHSAKKLFQQFLVDAYTMMESDRLSFVRSKQKKLRLDTYNDICNNVDDGNTEASNSGKRFIIPSSFTGGPRYMMQNYLDAMAIVRRFGSPDLFITFTCNPKWPEIVRFLNCKNSKPEDRPEILCRLFKIKLDSMIKDFKDNNVFGEVEAVIYTIEFQKRGLPHSHICLFLKSAYKFPTPEHVDSVISAEIPDKMNDPELYQLVSEFMMHGPCGVKNLKSPCMNIETKTCTKKFPKSFREFTSVDQDGYPLYRRRDNGFSVKKGESTLNNGFCVPYNSFLLRKYQSHINVEWCNQTGAIKYLFKYINKGPDRITAGIITSNSSTTSQQGSSNVDEIKAYYDCRYISACEASWRIFENELHYRTPAVERLSFHLQDEQPLVYEDSADLIDVLDKPTVAASQFTNWMELNKLDPNARQLSYIQIPLHYVWDASNRSWKPRKQRPKLGRIHYVPPSAGESYYLRILLNKVIGPTCYEDIRTVRNKVFPTFKDACYELGLLDDDKEYIEAIKEASKWASGHSLRRLFVMLLQSNNMSKPELVWSSIHKELGEDILHNQRALIRLPDYTMEQDQIDNHTLFEIENLLRNQGSSLKNFIGMPYPSDEYVINTSNRLVHDELRYDRKALQLEHNELFNNLTSEQRAIFEKITDAVDKDLGGVFFLYGYGGTGKTFLWKTLSSAIRSSGKIVLNVASSGIASLLLSGGRTAHSRFVIPININEDSFCSIEVNSQLADLLKQTSLIIWDEAPMIHKHCFEALDRTMRDIMRRTYADSEQKVFGGKVVVFGGDFRQILPVVPKGSRQDIVNASLNSSYLWHDIQVLKLTVNMRLKCDSTTQDVKEMTEFAQWILDIGNGTFGGPNDGEGDIEIPEEILLNGNDDPVMSIVQSTYPDVIANLFEPTYFQERAILAPTHEQVDKINDRLLEMVPGDEVVYLSSDTVDKAETSLDAHQGMGSPEFLNSLRFSGVPNHKIVLKIGVPIMLIRNIDQPNGLCNGTRLSVIKLEKSLIHARVITGTNIGFETCIPRMKISPSDKSLPFKITRKQFPISTCFAMTINKSQGQTLSQVGLFLPRPVFTHGQLYVAISRVKSKKGLKILLLDKDGNSCSTTKNVVYKEVLQNL